MSDRKKSKKRKPYEPPFEIDPVVVWEDLEEGYKLPYCREHVLGKGRLVAKGLFPAPQRYGEGPGSRLAWRRSQIEEWLANRPLYVPSEEDDDADDAAPE